MDTWWTYVRARRQRGGDFERKLRGISASAACFSVWSRRAACFSAWSRRTAAKHGAAQGRNQEGKRHEVQLAMLLAERDALLESNALYQEKLIAAEEMVRGAQG